MDAWKAARACSRHLTTVGRVRDPRTRPVMLGGATSDSIFAADSALMRGLSRVADVMLLNLLFIATSHPDRDARRIADRPELHRHADRDGVSADSVTGRLLPLVPPELPPGDRGRLLVLRLPGRRARRVVRRRHDLRRRPDRCSSSCWPSGTCSRFSFATTVLFVFPYLANFDGRTREVLRNAA